MNIENIEAFVYVNHYGSFNKAAEMLYLSQPSVTARIQTLERELNIKLFERQGKIVNLTEKGKLFLPYAQQLIQVFESGKQRIQQKSLAKHEIRIGCTISVANYVMPTILKKLGEHFPDVKFRIISGSSAVLLEKLLNHEIDFAFTRHMTHPQVYSEKLYNDPITLYVYPDHPFAEKREISVEVAASEKFIFFECGSLDWQSIHRIFQQRKFNLHIQFEVDNSETAKKCVANKSGISFLPSLCAKDLVDLNQLVPVIVKDIGNVSLQTTFLSLIGSEHEITKIITGFNYAELIPSKHIGISID